MEMAFQHHHFLFPRLRLCLLRTNHSFGPRIIHLLEQSMQAIQDRDYAICKIVGCDIVATLLCPAKAEDWSSLPHRESFFCGVLTTCIALCRDFNFLSAQNMMDSAWRRGLPSPCVERLEQYIRVFAEHMFAGPR
jgi:hypothetical protein